MRRLLTRTVLAVGASAAAVVLASSSASAATWVVANSPGTINGLAIGPTLIVHDPNGDQTLVCETGTATASIPNGSSNGTPVGQITDMTFDTCNLANLVDFNVAMSGFNYGLNAVSQSGDDVTGTVTASDIHAQIDGVGLGANCHITVHGTTVPAHYNNSTFQLSVNGGGNLTLTAVPSVSGCFNTVRAGDTAEFFAAYDTDAQATINVQ